MQQVVLFTYSVGVFAGYYFYTKYTTPETMKAEVFASFKKAGLSHLNSVNYCVPEK